MRQIAIFDTCESVKAELAAAAARKLRLVFTVKLMTGQRAWIIVLANESIRAIYILLSN